MPRTAKRKKHGGTCERDSAALAAGTVAVASILAICLNAVIAGYFLSFRIEPRIGSLEDALIDTYPGEKASLGLFLKQHFADETETLFFPTKGESWFVSEPRLWVLEMYWYPLTASVQERDYDPGLSASEVVELEGRDDALELHEGDAVGPLVVGEIEPSGVFFVYDGVQLRRRVGAR